MDAHLTLAFKSDRDGKLACAIDLAGLRLYLWQVIN